MEWDYQEFGQWLRKARVSTLPILSQDKVAEVLGVPQTKVSRWEKERSGTPAPTLDECLQLADLFGFDFLTLARMCGRWNDRIERRILVELATRSDGVLHPDSVSSLIAPLRRRNVDYGHSRTGVARPRDNRPTGSKIAARPR